MAQDELWAAASFSACKRYRYMLSRGNPAADKVLWLMLNPSIADGLGDDPTIRKVRGFTERLGFESFLVGNLAARVATKPRDLFAMDQAGDDIVGPECDKFLRMMMSKARIVVAAWGSHGDRFNDRIQQVMTLAAEAGHQLRTLGMTGNDQPTHPLMRPYALGLECLQARERLTRVGTHLAMLPPEAP